jgi:hypothetical protein
MPIGIRTIEHGNFLDQPAAAAMPGNHEFFVPTFWARRASWVSSVQAHSWMSLLSTGIPIEISHCFSDRARVLLSLFLYNITGAAAWVPTHCV